MKTSLGQLHHQATDWLRELDFYSEEITLLMNRLGDALSKNTVLELEPQYDDFKKQFNSLLQAIAQLKHDVSIREGVVENMTQENLGEDEVISTEGDVILKQMKELSHEIADTRFLFNFFLSRKA